MDNSLPGVIAVAAGTRPGPPSLAARAMRRLRLRHVELLLILGEVATVRSAAVRLNLSQPAVSKMIGEIEAICALPLFLRSRRGLETLPAGRVMIGHARAIHQQLASADATLGAMRRGFGSLLRIGSFSTTAVLPLAITLMRRDRPDIQVRIREAPPAVLIGQLLAGEFDCVVCALPSPLLATIAIDRLRVESVATDSICVVSAPTHRFARRRALAWRDVVASQWALPPADALMRQALTAALLQRGLRPPEPVVESLSAITMRWLVRFDTDLLGVMRLHQAREERAMGLLQILPVRPTIALPDISMITCRDTVDVANGAAVLMTALRQAGRRRDLLQPVAASR